MPSCRYKLHAVQLPFLSHCIAKSEWEHFYRSSDNHSCHELISKNDEGEARKKWEKVFSKAIIQDDFILKANKRTTVYRAK